MATVGWLGYAYCNLSFEHTFELTGEEVVPQSIDNMTDLINTIDPSLLARAWNLGDRAVRSRLNGERDLTMSEIGAVADLVGVDLFLHALRGSFH